MRDLDRLMALKWIADLLRDRDLDALSRAQAAKTQTEGLLRALDHNMAPSLPVSATAAQVAEKYGLWATNRRIELNLKHARDTAKWLVDREAAQRAFGRSEVLGRLLGRK